ncbi:MAG: polyphenol oxidase family protein [Acidimicrobiia bacterium]
MNRPPGVDGVAFTDSGDGDQRNDLTARAAVSAWLGISRAWATVRQVHGTTTSRASVPGELTEADALWTDVPGLPLAVFTADCFGVVLLSGSAVGVAHAGWRGAADGVVTALRTEMTAQGHEPKVAAVGPGIGPCCFEVGPEVAERFPHDVTETRWGTTSVDLTSAIRRQLEGVEVWIAGSCTMHDPGLYSHRQNRTILRHASITWVP